MKAIKDILLGLVGGSLLTGGALGAVGYWRINDLSHQNSQLKAQLNKLEWRNQNLSKTQVSLSEELNSIKNQREQAYDQTITALMQAKDNAGIQALYEMGVKAYNGKDYPTAYFALEQVHQANPKYKDIANQYPAAKAAYSKHQQNQLQKELSSTYAQGLDQQRQGQLAQAKASYQRVLALKPGYKDTNQRLLLVNRQLATLQQSQELAQKQKWLASTYQVGLQAQSLGRYAQAQAAYESIVSYAPNYKDSAKRLKAVKAKLPKAQASTSTQQSNCFAQGVRLGQCAKAGNPAQSCTQAELTQLANCKDNPDFIKGLQSVSGGQRQSGNPDDPNNLSLLKQLPELLKSL